MLLPQPIAHGRLVQRYKRFFADVALDDGREITAHCPNPGAMLGLNTPGLPCWVSLSDNPKRKLAHTLELVEADGGLVGINTLLPNRLSAEALAEDAIPELAGYAVHRREVKFGAASRVDFVLDPSRPASLLRGGEELPPAARAGPWPNSPTAWRRARPGTCGDLAAEVAGGARAVQLFVIQRTDCDRFAACADLDPAYAAGLLAAAADRVLKFCAMVAT